MAYQDDEVSTRGGKPNELYRFAGTYSTYRYTSGVKPVFFQAPDEDEEHEYIPIAMERTAINAGTQEDDQLDLTVTMAVTHQVVLDYGFQQTPPSLNLTIWRYHTLADVIPFWFGPVDNIATNNGKASIRSYSQLGAALSQDFPNVYYQSPCNNVLYDARCGVNEAAFSDDLEILAINGNVITLATVGDLDGKLVGGDLKIASGERRMITKQVQTTFGEDPDEVEASNVTINFPFTALEVGEVVTVAAGCDLAYRGDCKLKFANQRRFTGFPFIPPENPFSDGLDPANTLEDNTCLPICQPCPTSTTFSWDLSFNGCNPAYCPTRNWYMPEIPGRTDYFKFRPNLPALAPGETYEDYESNGWPGKTWGNTLSLVNNCAGVVTELYESNAYNDPMSGWYQDPRAIRLQGQLMMTATSNNSDFTIALYGANVTGGGQLQIQYGAFWCGDNIATATLTRNDCGGCEPHCGCAPTVLLEGVELVGNVPYTWTW